MERIDEANGRMSLDRTSGLEKGYLVRITQFYSLV